MRKARVAFGVDYNDKKACKDVGYAFDSHISDEATAVEIALSLHNPISEYEHDIFKCLLAREKGLAVDALLLDRPSGSIPLARSTRTASDF